MSDIDLVALKRARLKAKQDMLDYLANNRPGHGGDPITALEKSANYIGALEEEMEAIAALVRSVPAEEEAQPSQLTVPEGRTAYQITGWGETDLPEVAYADTLEGAKEAVVAMVFDDPIDGKAQATEENLLEGLDDETEWPWQVTFEIGGVKVEKVFIKPAAPAQGEAQ